LSLFRTPNPGSNSNKIKTAAAGLALTAAAAAAVGVWSASAASQPAASPWSDQFASSHGARAASDQAASQAGDRAARSAGANLALALWTTAPAAPQSAVLDAVTAKALPALGSPARGKRGHADDLTPRQIARGMLHSFHWSKWQFQWLNLLWSRESSWNVYAMNPYSGAYGIPQAVPGDKMASAGPDWQGDART